MPDCTKCGLLIPDGGRFCPWCGKKIPAPGTARGRTRANGMGTAVKRGNTWTAVWTEGRYIEDGKLHYKRRWKSGFKSKSAALRYAAAPEQEAPAVPTLRSYWQSYRDAELPKLSASKQTSHKIAWEKMKYLADKEMMDLTIDDLQGVISSKAPTYYPARDIKTVFSHLYKRAVAEGSARTNLSEFIQLPSLEEKETEPYTEVELHKLWKAYGDGDWFIGYMLVMIYTGMMPGELLQLEKEHIDYEKKEIVGCGLKTKKRKVTPIAFPDMLAPVLADLCERSDSKIGRVVCMNKDNFYKEYHAANLRAGVRDLAPYSCRHTTGTALALGNIAPSVIQEVMRHTKFSTTQRYIHPDISAARAAVNTLNKGAV